MKHFTVSLLVLASALVSANPIALRDNVCDVKPSGPTTSNKPISTPTAANAAACQVLCAANTACLSFVFGMAPKPQCMLFAVPAAQIPPQSDAKLKAFDRACEGVPTTAPAGGHN